MNFPNNAWYSTVVCAVTFAGLMGCGKAPDGGPTDAIQLDASAAETAAQDSPTLVDWPAPASGEDLVPERVMLRLVPLLKRYFDRVILDSPAGVGRGFRAAAAAADCALIVCNSDPVCIRDASIVRRLLTELEVPQQRLVINRFNAEYFGSLSAGREDAGGLRDLDDVIDQSGVRLIGIVPEDRQMTAAFQRGCVPADDLPGMTALSRIAARMNGVSVPLSL